MLNKLKLKLVGHVKITSMTAEATESTCHLYYTQRSRNISGQQK